MNTTTLAGIKAQNARIPSLFARVGRRIRRWRDLNRQRWQLAKMDERTLRDLGISHIEARQEARRWFWDDPLA
jgi:uncharacterized protein YjiS (DUF1127 family)